MVGIHIKNRHKICEKDESYHHCNCKQLCTVDNLIYLQIFYPVFIVRLLFNLQESKMFRTAINRTINKFPTSSSKYFSSGAVKATNYGSTDGKSIYLFFLYDM